MATERTSDPSAAGGLLRWLVPSTGSILALTALVNALFFRGAGMFAADGDVGRHIRLGRTILETGAIPRIDLFSHTRAGQPFVPYEWLSEVITALVHSLAGLPGVAVLSALLYVVAVLTVYRAGEALGATRPVAFVVAVMALLLQSVHLLPRPHLFTTAFVGLFVVVLLRFAREGRAWTLAPLPLLMLVWANSHGGFLVGFIVLAAFVAGALVRSPEFVDGRRAVRPLLVVLVACVAASLLNPVGLDLWRHTTGYLGTDFLVGETHEYRSPDFHQGYGKILFVVMFVGPVLWMSGRVRVSWLAAGLYLFFAAAALHSARNIPLFTVAALPWLAIWSQDALAGGGPRSRAVGDRLRRLDATDRRLRPGLTTVAAVALAWIAVGPRAPDYRFDAGRFPVRAARALETDATTGRVFNQMIWGGYLLYARPDIPVFIDGQTDFYGEELSRQYLVALKGREGWRRVLVDHDVSWTLTAKGEPLNQLLALTPGWEKSYEDEVAVIYRRTAGSAAGG